MLSVHYESKVSIGPTTFRNDVCEKKGMGL